MTNSPHNQAYAYRRNPAQSIHPSTFQPAQYGHGHNGTVYEYSTRPPQAHYVTSTAAFQPAQSTAVIEQKSEDKPASSGSGFSLASLAKYANPEELKGLMDRFGGLDGILSTVTTVQKVMSTVGQIAPMVKVFTGVLGNKNKNGEADTTSSSNSIPARRRVRSTRPRSQRTSTNTRRQSSSSRSSTQRRSTPLSKKQGN